MHTAYAVSKHYARLRPPSNEIPLPGAWRMGTRPTCLNLPPPKTRFRIQAHSPRQVVAKPGVRRGGGGKGGSNATSLALLHQLGL